MNKFAEFADTNMSPIMDGKKIPLDDILNKEIIVLRYKIKKSKFTDAKNPECLTVQFAYPREGLDSEPAPETEHFVFFSGSSVLMQQLEQYKDKLPFQAVIKKVGKYFTFS
ncbi:MAG: hypothetical protein Pg6C_10100 [Treponemataceae bacterium]|jgi:hypothetical protein|nr:MAG: hypothetical protein Pg6C_10100 [Treponemataceae bacterium]